PTRLLDLGSGPLATVRLIKTSSTPLLGPYVTLSYCRGSAPTVKLTTATLATFMTLLSARTLPATFRDAIEVTRHLGIRYLWIDSPCIIQDSADDWTAESSAMGCVYQNGLFNIAATASNDSGGGLFSVDRDPRTVCPAVAMSNWDYCISSTYTVSRKNIWKDGVSDAVLNTRGWVLQEQFLSPRILHFGVDRMYWECRELEACETFPRGLPQAAHREGRPLTGRADGKGIHLELRPPWEQSLIVKGLNFRDDDGELSPPWQKLPTFKHYRVWRAIVETYSRTHLSHAKDKLVAISGLAREARRVLNDDYLAGLWRKHLAWERSHSRPSAYRCPTRSWAPIDGEITQITEPTTFSSSTSLKLTLASPVMMTQVSQRRFCSPSGLTIPHLARI
ncbi:heterokaryon incompatibility protein-domain-containing protein, partial [Lasiosphaeria hispida]